jgi:hypothetical protein
MLKTLLIICTTIFSLQAYAKSAFFSTNSSLLFIPEVEINNKIHIRGVLELKDNGQYIVRGLHELEANQEALLLKIKSIPCGVADTLGLFSAYKTFTEKNNKYCLSKYIFTTEGDKIFSYLFVENGSIKVITDIRSDRFMGCCKYIVGGDFDSIQFGYMDNEDFIQQTALSDIDFEHKYIIRLIKNNEVLRQF